MSDGEQDFAAFEARVAAGNDPAADAGEVGAAKAPADGAGQPEAGKTAEPGSEPLELTEGDEAVDVAEGEEGGEDHQDADGKRRRSKPAHLRIAELTAKLRDAERKLQAKDAPEPAKALDRPDPAAFEFGEADPAYIDALTDWKIDSREAERTKASEVTQARQQFVERINTGVSTAETTGKEKYPDFDAKVQEAVEARAGEPMPPILTVGIATSPVGGDIIYRLATDDAVSAKLEKLAKGGEASQQGLALALGELEGEYIADGDDDDLDIADQLDMARMMGRMRARLKGAGPKPEAAKVVTTNAPEPPAERARGSAGKFEVGADTNDFAAFERMANRKR